MFYFYLKLSNGSIKAKQSHVIIYIERFLSSQLSFEFVAAVRALTIEG